MDEWAAVFRLADPALGDLHALVSSLLPSGHRTGGGESRDARGSDCPDNHPKPAMTKHHTHRTALPAALTLLALSSLSAPSARAQAVPASANPPPVSSSPSDASGDDLIVLSPFRVEAGEDHGYQATATLAGTRIRTELKDVGSAVSVVTEAFLRDTGATNNETLLVYTTNTEVGGTKGNFGGVGNGRELNESFALLRPSSNTRVRGLTAADNTRDFFLTDIPWDGYNVGRVDMQRGPNAILFGMGSPAGIINNSTNQASFKSSGKLELRFDNEGGTRANFDYNQVALRNELAFRVAGVTEHNQYRQDPSFSRDDRSYGALRYDPSFLKGNGMATSLRLNYESGKGHSNRPRNITPGDNITAWWEHMGKAVFDPNLAWQSTGPRQFRISGGDQNGQLNAQYNPWLSDYGSIFGQAVSTFAQGQTTQERFATMEANGYWGIGKGDAVDGGILSQAAANGYYGIGAPGAWDKGIGGIPFARPVGVASYAGWAFGSANPANPEIQGQYGAEIGAFKERGLSDAGLFDFYNKLLDGENKREWRGFEAWNATLSQTFLNNRVGVEAVYDSQRYHDGQTDGVRQNIYLDPNTRWLDGKANSHTGQAFVQHNNGGREYRSNSDAYRVTAFGELRATDLLSRSWLTRLLGRHVFTGMYASEEKKTRSLSFMEYAFDSAYMQSITGSDVEGNKLTNRGPQRVSYLSGNLGGLATYSEAHLDRVVGERVPNSQQFGVYRFDSHWAKPINPADPQYINPSAEWIDSAGGVSTQSENPANYKGWAYYPANPLISYSNGGAGGLYTDGLKTYRQVGSQAFVWQGYLLDNVLVPSIGWRKDVYKGGNVSADRGAYNQVTNLDWEVDKSTFPKVRGESLSWSLVGHTPDFLRAKLPLNSGLSLFFNKSENFRPSPGDIDMFGNLLPNPSGKTKDYGFVLSTLHDRLSLKVNWYRTEVTNDRLSGFEFWRIPGTVSTLFVSASRVRNKDMSPGADWRWNYSQWTANGGQAQADKGAQAVLDAYNGNPVVRNFVNSWGFSNLVNAQDGSYWTTPPGTTATADTISKGLEFELFARPLDNWDLTLNASKTSATQNNIGGTLKTWIQAMDPLFQGPAGDLRQWWAGDGNTMRRVWNSEIMSQFNRLKAQEGGDVPELRKWRMNLISNYNFRGGWFKGVNLGVAYRWEDKLVIGYPVITRPNPLSGASEIVYDVDHPYYGPTEGHVDLWLGYGHRVTSKIDWRIQLNVRDLLAEKKLVPISCEPDGTPAGYRIPELTSWSITNTFSF